MSGIVTVFSSRLEPPEPPPLPRWVPPVALLVLGIWLTFLVGNGPEKLVNRAVGPGRATSARLSAEAPPVLLVEGIGRGDEAAVERFLHRVTGEGHRVVRACESWLPWLLGILLLFLLGLWLLSPAYGRHLAWIVLGLPKFHARGPVRALCRVTAGVLILGLPIWAAGWWLGLLPGLVPIAWCAAVPLSLLGGRPWGSSGIRNSTLPHGVPAGRLSRAQRAAVLVMSLPPEVAARVFREMGAEAVHAVTSALAGIGPGPDAARAGIQGLAAPADAQLKDEVTDRFVFEINLARLERDPAAVPICGQDELVAFARRDPEIAAQVLVSLYLQEPPAPSRRRLALAAVAGMLVVFGLIGCGRWHVSWGSGSEAAAMEARARMLVERSTGRTGVGVSIQGCVGGPWHCLIAVESLGFEHRASVRTLVSEGLGLCAARGDTLELVSTEPGWPARLFWAGIALTVLLTGLVLLPAGRLGLRPGLTHQLWGQGHLAARGWLAVALLGSLACAEFALQVPVFVALAAGLGWRASQPQAPCAPPAPAGRPLSVAHWLAVDRIRLDLGHSLANVAAGNGPDSVACCIRAIRMTLAVSLGVELPPVRVRQTQALASDEWRLLVGELEVERGTVKTDRHLAWCPENRQRLVSLRGARATEPLSGQPAVWISPEQVEEARKCGCRLLAPAQAMARRLTLILHRQAHRLLGLQDTANLVERYEQTHPAVVKAVLERMSLTGLHGVLRGLLEENVTIRDFASILETLAASGGLERNARIEEVRRVMAPVFLPRLTRGTGVLRALAVSRRTAERLASGDLVGPLRRVSVEGGVLLVPGSMRREIREQVKIRFPHLPVLAYEETSGVTVRIIREL